MLIALLLMHLQCFGAAEDPGELIQRADRIKTADNAGFLKLLQQLDGQADRLTPLQRDWVAYLKGWQFGLRGDFPAAEAALKVVVDRTQDRTLQARARISLINDQALASHYEDAYANLNQLLELLPQIEDPLARNFSFGVAALLYNHAGQYDLALQYGHRWLELGGDTNSCKATSQIAETLFRTGKLRADDPQLHSGLDACVRIGDALYANLIRISVANALFDQGRVTDARTLLEVHDEEMLSTNAGPTISRFRALLARCYLATGEIGKAREFAQSVVDYSAKLPYSKPIADAYEVLYQAAKRQGDEHAALSWYEKYATADKGFLNDETARTLAYQMVNQHVLDKKRQIDALNDANKLLQLKQQVDGKSAEAARLYMLLLLAGLGSIAWWAWRTKLSQLRFQKLARRDSLTGIFNRQHFLDAATIILRYGSKSARDACLLVIDLDNFKTVNDTYGHATGDMVLKRAVSACERHLRSIDLFGRLGGEEFGILLTDCTVQDAVRRAEQLRVAIAGLCGDEGQMEFPVSASFGIAATAASGYDLTQLLMDADHALYRAKREGRNRVALFQSEPVGASAHAT